MKQRKKHSKFDLVLEALETSGDPKLKPTAVYTVKKYDKQFLSLCHDAKVYMGGGDPWDDEGHQTHYYVCDTCGEPCAFYEENQ